MNLREVFEDGLFLRNVLIAFVTLSFLLIFVSFAVAQVDESNNLEDGVIEGASKVVDEALVDGGSIEEKAISGEIVEEEEIFIEENIVDEVLLDEDDEILEEAVTEDFGSNKSEDVEINTSEEDYVFVDLGDIEGNFSDTGETDVFEVFNKSENIEDLEGSSEEVLGGEDKVDKEIVNEKKLVRYILFNGGEKEIETKIFESEDVEITKESRILEPEEGFGKEVIVSSEEHFDRELVVYEDIDEVNEKAVKVFWFVEGERIDITDNSDFDLRFYDRNDNGLYDRISWIVPHLSEQTFQIILDLSEENVSGSTNSSYINLRVLSAPSGVYSSLDNIFNFSFEVDRSELNGSLKCEFNLEDSNGGQVFFTEVHGLSNNVTVRDLQNDTYNWEFRCFDTGDLSINDSESDIFMVGINQIPNVSLTSDRTSVYIGEDVRFFVDVSSEVAHDYYYLLDYGDSSNSGIRSYPDVDQFNEEYTHSYSSVGNYDVNLSLTYDGDKKTSRKLSVSVTEDPALSSGETDPEVDLLSPVNDKSFSYAPEDFDDMIIDFEYKVTDVNKIVNCTFELYKWSDNSSFAESISLADSVAVDKSITSGETNTLSLKFFEDDGGDYTWGVTCFNNYSNSDYQDRDFSINLEGGQEDNGVESSSRKTTQTVDEDYDRKDDVEGLLENINAFLENYESYDLKERNALEDMQIVDDLLFYKRKLLQIRLDLQHNLEFMTDDVKRAERKSEIFGEIDDIKDKVIVDVDVLEEYEYVKNGIHTDISGLVDSYVEYSGLVLSSSEKRALERGLIGLQSDLSTSVIVRDVELDYGDRKERVTLVSKDVSVKDDSFGVIIESIPKDVASSMEDLYVINTHKIISEDPIFEIEVSDLVEDKIVYYLKDVVDLKTIESTATIAFSDSIRGEESSFISLSGFSVFSQTREYGDFVFYLSWILFIVLILVILDYIYVKIRRSLVSKDRNVKVCLDLINRSREHLKSGDFNSARAEYDKIKQIYVLLSDSGKKFVFKKIGALKAGLDVAELDYALNDIKSSLYRGDRESAISLYTRVREIYDRLPEKSKNKIYPKISSIKSLF